MRTIIPDIIDGRKRKLLKGIIEASNTTTPPPTGQNTEAPAGPFTVTSPKILVENTFTG